MAPRPFCMGLSGCIRARLSLFPAGDEQCPQDDSGEENCQGVCGGITGFPGDEPPQHAPDASPHIMEKAEGGVGRTLAVGRARLEDSDVEDRNHAASAKAKKCTSQKDKEGIGNIDDEKETDYHKAHACDKDAPLGEPLDQL